MKIKTGEIRLIFAYSFNDLNIISKVAQNNKLTSTSTYYLNKHLLCKEIQVYIKNQSFLSLYTFGQFITKGGNVILRIFRQMVEIEWKSDEKIERQIHIFRDSRVKEKSNMKEYQFYDIGICIGFGLTLIYQKDGFIYLNFCVCNPRSYPYRIDYEQHWENILSIYDEIEFKEIAKIFELPGNSEDIFKTSNENDDE